LGHEPISEVHDYNSASCDDTAVAVGIPLPARDGPAVDEVRQRQGRLLPAAHSTIRKQDGLTDRQIAERLASESANDNAPGGCLIKGNISGSGEHIYHAPGGRFYDATKIDPSKGQRWFCTEAEARAAGWRKSKR